MWINVMEMKLLKKAFQFLFKPYKLKTWQIYEHVKKFQAY